MVKKEWKKKILVTALAVMCLCNQSAYTVNGMKVLQETAEVMETTESAEAVTGNEELENTERAGKTEESESTERTEGTEEPESTEKTESTEEPESTEKSESTEVPGSTEQTESEKETESAEEVERTEKTEVTESIEQTDEKEKIEETEMTEGQTIRCVLKLETDKKQKNSGVELSEKNFPDGLFRDYIGAKYDTNEDGVLSDTEIARIVSLDIEKEISVNDKHRKIRSLRGIEFFTNLTKLSCRYMDFLGELDLSNCKKMENLVCDNNIRLTKIILTNCKKLKTFECEYNTALTSIDFTGCTSLADLEFNENALSNIKLSALTELRKLYLNESGITSVNIGKLGKLQEVVCTGENITQFNAQNCKKLKNLRVESSRLASFQINGCTALKELSVVGGKLTEMDVNKYKKLEKLDLRKLNLSKLDLSGNKCIKEVSCKSNQKKMKVDFSGCSNLENVYCNNSNITSLNVSDCTSLKELECYRNLLKELDLSNLQDLEYVSCYSNKLEHVDVTNCSNLKSLNCIGNCLTSLDITSTQECGIAIDDNCYTVKSGKYIDLSNLPGFSMFKVSNIQGGKQISPYSPVVELTDLKNKKITYDYDIKYGWNVSFSIYFENPKAKVDISTFRIDLSKSSYVYNGKAKRPAVTVEGGLKKGKDYTVSYRKNKAVGIASVIVKGKGKYTGTARVTFEITPKKVQIKNIAGNGKGQLLVKWNRNTTASGYEVCYTTRKNFNGNMKVIDIKNKKTVSKRIKDLTSGKRYYVRVRPYKTSGGQKVYGDWSDAASVIVR